MRQIQPFFTFCFVAAFLVIAAACSKTGPAGATGPAGPAGPAGTTGAAGAAGPAGTANVIYSDWTTPAFVADTQHNGAVIDTVGSHYSWTAAKLTADILNKGEIKVYINLGTTAAPDVLPIPYFDGQIIVNDEFSLSTIFMYSNVYISGIPFRYILIPGGTAARSAVDWNNYASVKKYLNLKD